MPDGQINYYTTVRGPDILLNVIVSGYVAFYQINKCFANALFSLLAKRLCGRIIWFRGPD